MSHFRPLEVRIPELCVQLCHQASVGREWLLAAQIGWRFFRVCKVVRAGASSESWTWLVWDGIAWRCEFWKIEISPDHSDVNSISAPPNGPNRSTILSGAMCFATAMTCLSSSGTSRYSRCIVVWWITVRFLNPQFPAAAIVLDNDATSCANVALALFDAWVCWIAWSEGALKVLNARLRAAKIVLDNDATGCADVAMVSADAWTCCIAWSEGALKVLNAWLRAAEVGRVTAPSKKGMSSPQ